MWIRQGLFNALRSKLERCSDSWFHHPYVWMYVCKAVPLWYEEVDATLQSKISGGFCCCFDTVRNICTQR